MIKKQSNIMKIKRYEAKDEDELLNIIDEDPDKLKGWEGPIEAHLRSVRYPPKKGKTKVRAVNK
jgi:hypothetical protein